MDRNHDRRLHLKYVQVAKNRWITWNCDAIDHMDLPLKLMLYLHRFVRVRQLHLSTTMAGTHFVQCTCQGHKHEGVPCSCFFRIFDDAGVRPKQIDDLGMVDACYLRM